MIRVSRVISGAGRNGLLGSLAAILFAAAGLLALNLSGAASFAASSEVEDGLKHGTAVIVSDTNASAGQSVKFGGSIACANSDGTACPASYFNGPLGANNIIPPKTGAFLIEQYGGIGVNWSQKQAKLIERKQFIGRPYDAIHVQYSGGSWDGVQGMENPALFTPRQEQFALDQGSSFVAVTWSVDFTIGEVNNGAADAIWAKAANYWKSYAPNRIMLRPFVEFNLPKTSSAVPSAGNGSINYCGTPFISAWQRMVNVFQQNGATNVGFWFSPDEGNNRQCVIDSWPGDAYVDWSGSDSYNWCYVGDTSCYSTPVHAGWGYFGELFGYAGNNCASGTCPKSQHDLFGLRKPFIVGETGTIYDVNSPATKGQHYNRIPAEAKQMKYLRGVSFFDQDVSAFEGPKTNWWVDHPVSNPSVYNGYKAMAQDPWFNTR